MHDMYGVHDLYIEMVPPQEMLMLQNPSLKISLTINQKWS